MVEADRAEFERFVRGFASQKAKPAPSMDALDLWWYSLADWSIEEFRAAAVHLDRTLAFMPQPADFHRLRLAARQTAGEAFDLAVQASKGCSQGGYMSDNVTSGDALVDRAARALGGYRVIALSEVSKLCFLEQRFAEHYEAMRNADDVRQAVPQLTNRRPAELTDARTIVDGLLRQISRESKQ